MTGAARRRLADARPGEGERRREPDGTFPAVRAPSEIDETAAHVGSRVRTLRNRKGWTLTEAAEALGVGRSTLAKLEAGRMSPTLNLLHRISTGLSVPVAALVAEPETRRPSGRRVVTPAGQGLVVEADHHRHEMLCDGLAGRRMTPFRTVIKPRREPGVPPWFRHVGEEFVLVLEGRVTFHSEYYTPTTLGPGDSIYLDAQMGHCFVAEDGREAVVLFVVSEHED